MSESTLTLGYPDLRAELGAHLGYGRTTANWDTEQTATVESILQRGMRQFYVPPVLPGQSRSHSWRFLHPVTTLTTVAPYSTGTVSSVGTTVTLTGGTWPSWAATHGTLTVDETDYEIASRDSDTELTLSAAPGTAFSDDDYDLEHDGNYDLPDDFGGIEGRFTYAKDEATYTFARGVDVVGEGLIRAKRQFSITDNYPKIAAIRCKAATGVSGQRWEVLLWPVPDAVYNLSYRYTAIPGKLTSALPYPLGGALHSETILASCMAAAELKVNGVKAELWATFMERLAASVSLDSQATDATYFGYNGDHSDASSRELSQRTNYVRFKGTLYSG